jgi:hypothetical protein
MAKHMSGGKRMRKFDIRKIRKLAAPQRYGELYFYFREAEQLIASNFPHARRYGKRLKRRVENLYSQWFKPLGHPGSLVQAVPFPES